MRRWWLRSSVLTTLLLTLGLWIVPVPTAAVDVGEKAPDFLLHSTIGESIRLADYQGKKNILLFFFVAAFTGV